jgi:hypothetical protein
MSHIKRVIFTLLFVSLAVFSFGQGAGAARHMKKGENVVGAKLALGGVYGADLGFAANFEHGFQEGFLDMKEYGSTLGLGGSIGYSSYTSDFFGEWTFSSLIFLGTAYWHLDLFQVPELDTYSSFSLGYVSFSSEGPNGIDYNFTDYGGVTWGFGAGFRYYLNPKLAVAGELGVGMGILRLGVDYKL